MLFYTIEFVVTRHGTALPSRGPGKALELHVCSFKLAFLCGGSKWGMGGCSKERAARGFHKKKMSLTLEPQPPTVSSCLRNH